MKPLYFVKRKLQLVPAATILVALAISIPLSAQTITTFDAPGAGTGAFQGTFPFCVDPSGTVIGRTRDAGDVRHGFIRFAQGSYTIFDAPGAGTAGGQGTWAYATNPKGEITGFFYDSTTAAHGYVRSNQGVITVFDAPGAGTGPFQGTFPASPLIINPNGAIAGWSTDSSDVNHGFLRDKNGAITTFDDPGAGTVPGSLEGTYPFGINTNGAITGWYVDGADVNHGFVRDNGGAIVEFDVPGAGTDPGQGPYPFSIAPNGAVTGFSYDADNVVHGFVLTK
jgi:hypothetical protein